MNQLKTLDEFQSPNNFSQMIEKLAIDEHDGSVLTAITSYCELKYFDVEEVTSLFSPSLIEKIKIEARKRKLIIGDNAEELPFL